MSESESRSVVSDSLQPHGLYSPWNSLGQNTGVGSLSLLQGIFPTQGFFTSWATREVLSMNVCILKCWTKEWVSRSPRQRVWGQRLAGLPPEPLFQTELFIILPQPYFICQNPRKHPNQKYWASETVGRQLKRTIQKNRLSERKLIFPGGWQWLRQPPERLLSWEALVCIPASKSSKRIKRRDLRWGNWGSRAETETGGTASRQHIESGPPGAENLLPGHSSLHQPHAAQLRRGDKGCPAQGHLRMKSPISPMYTEKASRAWATGVPHGRKLGPSSLRLWLLEGRNQHGFN